MCDMRLGRAEESAVVKIEMLMGRAGVSVADRPVVTAALRRAEETEMPAVAIELPDGSIITGKTTPLLGASAAALLNSLKALGAH